jgi:hypothetical protein
VHQAIVERVKRPIFYRPRTKIVDNFASAYPEEVLAFASKFEGDPRYVVTIIDHTGCMGNYDDRLAQPDEQRSWDMHEDAESAQPVDPSLPF